MKKKYILAVVILLLVALPFLFFKLTIYPKPDVQNYELSYADLEMVNDSTFVLGNNWLRQNAQGDWECYIEGNAYQRGMAMGMLQKGLIEKQEEVFVAEIERLLPNAFYRGLIQYGVAWFNRDLDNAIPPEYLHEIYGVSEGFSDNFDYIGPKLNRVLNYHAAHDIGHMVQNMNLVACTAIAQWNDDEESPQMLLGRNFDFYFGDDFAKNKIILFMNPEEGYDFVSVTWGGFCGVVSGMNEEGLSVTLNSLPSEIPSKSSMPVSIIAREVVQYASTIEEAYKIIKRNEVFVSESFTIVSAKDKKAAVIEKTPDATEIYYPTNNKLIVTNHFQSDSLKDTQLNKEHILESESMARFERVQQLAQELDSNLSPENILDILREQKGVDDKDLGVGNPMAINQLLAHHAVVFDVYTKTAWISTYPFQENLFNAYDVSSIRLMGDKSPLSPTKIDSLTLAKDSFFNSEDYQRFLTYKELKSQFFRGLEINQDSNFSASFFVELLESNSKYYEPYVLTGDYYLERGDRKLANEYYSVALTKAIPYQSYVDDVKSKMSRNQ